MNKLYVQKYEETDILTIISFHIYLSCQQMIKTSLNNTKIILKALYKTEKICLKHKKVGN